MIASVESMSVPSISSNKSEKQRSIGAPEKKSLVAVEVAELHGSILSPAETAVSFTRCMANGIRRIRENNGKLRTKIKMILYL
jgi:hypothetical protein